MSNWLQMVKITSKSDVGALDSHQEPRIKVEKSRARNPAPPPLKGLS